VGDQIERYLKQVNSFQILFCLCVLGLLAYGQTVFYPFVHDDRVFIEHNPSISDLSQPFDFFFKPSLPRADSVIINTYYRPLLEIVYRIQYRLWGLDPGGYHLVNVLLHITNSFLVYWIGWLLIRKKALALGAAILFLIHPVQTQAVASIVGISNLLFSLWCLLSFLFYIQSKEKSKNFAVIFSHGLAIIFFALALWTKEQAVALPFLAVLYEYCFVGEDPKAVRQKWLRVAGLFIVLIGYLYWRELILGQRTVLNAGNYEEFCLRILSIPQTLVMFVGLLVWPVNLHYYRCVNVLEPFWPAALMLVAVTGVLAAVIYFYKSNRNILVFGLGWFVMALAPTLNIAPVINEFSFASAAEHFLYFPLIGFLFFVVLIFVHFAERIFRDQAPQRLMIFWGVIFFIFTAATIRQNTFWRGEIPLFERTIIFEKHLGRTHILLARAYYFAREWDKSIEHFTHALNIMEQYAHQAQTQPTRNIYLGFIKGIHFDLAHCYEALGNTAAAIEQYKKALAIDPLDSVLYNSLGTQYLMRGDFDQARGQLQKALELDPQNLMAMSNLAVCLIQQGNRSEAEGLLRKVLAIDKNFVSARQNLEKFLTSE